MFTVCITTYKRPDCLARLQESLNRYLPNVPVLVQDTGGNLSWGRNRLIERVETPFALFMDDDFEVHHETRIAHFLKILRGRPEIGVVGGYVVEDGRARAWRHDMDRRGNQVSITPSMNGWKAIDDVKYLPCEIVLNWMMIRKEVAEENPWDEAFELNEHAPWFWALRRTRWRVAYCPVGIFHHKDRPTEEYDQMRRRSFAKLWQERCEGVRSFKLQEPDTRPRPNVVVLGVGHANTSIVTRQLGALGWHLNDADNDYCESLSTRRINRGHIRDKEQFAALRAARLIESMETPWAIKDPRFISTLDKWHEALAPHEPVLLYITKDFDRVVQSYVNRDQHGRTEQQYRKIVGAKQKAGDDQYKKWPWQKMKVDAAQVCEAVSMFDVGRSN